MHIFKVDLKGKNEEKVTGCVLFGRFGLAHKKRAKKGKFGAAKGKGRLSLEGIKSDCFGFPEI